MVAEKDNLTPKAAQAGVPVIGAIFLLLALFKFFQGDGWVVWAILGFLFGGFGIFTLSRSGGTRK